MEEFEKNTLPLTFLELSLKHRFHFACAIMRNDKDGKIWHQNFRNAHTLMKYLEKLNLDPNVFSRHYKLNFKINSQP